jgi:5-methylthioadenosine/S-adenosylhomocysteine deaminase
VFLVRGRYVLTMDSEMRVIRDGCVAVDDGVVVDVGAFEELRRRYGGEVLGGDRKLVMPGLVNCHIHSREHLAVTAFPEGVPEERWFPDYCVPYHVWLDPEGERLAFKLALCDMALNGVTCFADGGLMYPETTLKVVENIQLRCLVSTWCWDLPQSIPKTAEQCMRELENLYTMFHNTSDGLVRASATPISVPTCSDKLLRDVFLWAMERNLPVFIHVASIWQDVETTVRQRGCTPVRHLSRLGVLHRGVNLLHSIYLSDDDVGVVSDAGVGVVACPASAAVKGKGLGPHGKFPELLERGVRVGLGVDGAPSAHHSDMLRMGALFAGILRDSRTRPGLAASAKVLRMLTAGGAELLGLGTEVGSIERGKRADLTVFDINTPLFFPTQDIYRSTLFTLTGCRADTVIVNGRPVVVDGRLLGVSLEEVWEEVERYLERRGVGQSPM